MSDYCQISIPTPTSDVSGAASALYELGGMTVIHDASGCNSTYSTHDEPRWETMDSAVYISALNEMDAVLGNEAALADSLVETVESLSPAFVALAGTIIPMMTGSDLKGIAREVEERTGAPSFALSTNGMRAYSIGAAQAWIELARRFVKPATEVDPARVNLLGLTPLDFSIKGEDAALVAPLASRGLVPAARWAMGSSLEELSQTTASGVNAVVSSAGLPLGQVLERHLGMPTVTGIPFGEAETRVWLDLLERAAREKRSFDLDAVLQSDVPERAPALAKTTVYILHEPLRARELARFVSKTLGVSAVPISMLPALGVEGVRCGLAEDELEALLGEAPGVFVADPLYFTAARRAGVPENRLAALPHEAASGRLYRDAIPNLFESEALALWLSSLERALRAC